MEGRFFSSPQDHQTPQNSTTHSSDARAVAEEMRQIADRLQRVVGELDALREIINPSSTPGPPI